ncbi:hypothetical protein BH10CYA1_BH10CYA1_16760 [soil metagenome]
MSGENAEPAVEERRTEVITIGGPLERGIDHIDRKLATGVNLTLDFTGCKFISVDGLEWLEELLLRSDSLGSKVVFTNLVPPVYKVFKVAHIDSLLRACGAPSQQSEPFC